MCRNVKGLNARRFFSQNVIPKNPNLYSSFAYVKKKKNAF